MSDVLPVAGSTGWAPLPTTTERDFPEPAHSGSIAKSALIVFKPQRLAEDNWQILVFFPGVKGECTVHFDTEDAAKQWIAQSFDREKSSGTQPNRR
jgi:hypothetical protein